MSLIANFFNTNELLTLSKMSAAILFKVQFVKCKFRNIKKKNLSVYFLAKLLK